MTAVAPVVISGNGVWVGWPGMHMEDRNEPIPESDPNDRTPTAGLLSRKVCFFLLLLKSLFSRASRYIKFYFNETSWRNMESKGIRRIFHHLH